jgi:anti-sigma factor RsiW
LSDHLTSATLSALADGELIGDQLVEVNEHLAACPQCTSSALEISLLKSATARAGQRYAPPPEMRERLTRLASQESLRPLSRGGRGWSSYGWAAAAAVLLVFVGTVLVQYSGRSVTEHARLGAYAELVTEASDQHIATLAANSPPEVISSDRHTVKPWFQGKLPFSFNLPQNLPGDTTLDGANLTYLHSQPTAQLLYSIGKHRVSVFVQQRTETTTADGLLVSHTGFHLASFHTADLEVVAVSDVDPARLSDLADKIEQAQAETSGQPK